MHYDVIGSFGVTVVVFTPADACSALAIEEELLTGVSTI